MRCETRTIGGLHCLAALLLLAGCGRAEVSNQPARREEVEIAPGHFITVERRDQSAIQTYSGVIGAERTKLSIPFGGVLIEWEGEPIPVCLRESEGRLYMIGADREAWRRETNCQGPAPIPNRYYRQEGARLVEIRPAEFPKRIATGNIGLRTPHDIKENLELDVAVLQNSAIGRAWVELMTGQPPTHSTVDSRLLEEYIRRYDPIRLTRIRKEDSAQAPATARAPTTSASVAPNDHGSYAATAAPPLR